MEAHATRVVVWDVPVAVAPGAAFRVKVGVKCAADCSSAGRIVEMKEVSDEALETFEAADIPDVDWAPHAEAG